MKLTPESYSLSSDNPNYPASNCVNNDYSDFCHGAWGSTSGVLSITVNGRISSIVVYNRAGSSAVQNRWHNARIRVDGTQVGTISASGNQDQQTFAATTSSGQHVITIVTRDLLNLAEVEIFGSTSTSSTGSGTVSSYIFGF